MGGRGLDGSFTPAVGSGANQVDLSWSTDNNGGCGGQNNGADGDFNKVAKPYVADDRSGPVRVPHGRKPQAGRAGQLDGPRLDGEPQRDGRLTFTASDRPC